jgi:hypothetical protein
VARRAESLIARIEHDALDENASLATALRKCIALGGRSGPEQLRDWATRELKGYHGEDKLPDYRVIPAPLLIDGFTGTAQITHQPFPPSALPDVAQGRIKEEVELRDGVGSIEALARKSEIRLGPPMATDLVRVINAESDNPYQQITHLYWAVSPAAVHGVLDQIRTSLTQLVAELRANMGDRDEIPSAEAADQAVNVIVTGKRPRVSVTTAQTTGSESPATAIGAKAQDDSGFWTRSRRIGAFIVGLATVAAAVLAAIEIL